VAGAGAAGTSA